MSAAKRIGVTLGMIAVPFILGLLITYQVIQIDWVSFMEIQPRFRAMEDPLPLPAGSIPVEGVAYMPGMGAPQNPVTADAVSLERGRYLYDLNCALCHGAQGHGDGSVAEVLRRKPADLTTPAVQDESDGAIFVTITAGVPNLMPPLVENLTVRDRWDVVNYVRTLK